jgi:hypothetical protein
LVAGAIFYRITMSKLKHAIADAKGIIYYTDTDSIVTDLQLQSKMPFLMGSAIEKLILENKITKGYFITGKTYYIEDDNKTIKLKTKKVNSFSLNQDSYLDRYNNRSIIAQVTSSLKNKETCTVIINSKRLKLNCPSYVKRVKL